MNRFLSLIILLMGITPICHAVSINEQAPQFERIPLQGGTPISLAAYRGKVVFLDFWASWCGPCRQSMPVLDEIRQELAPRGFEILAINMDFRVEDALRFLRDYPVSYPVLRDTGVLPETYGLEVMPTSYLIDRQGFIRHIHYGYRRGDGAQLRSAFLQLLEETDD